MSRFSAPHRAAGAAKHPRHAAWVVVAFAAVIVFLGLIAGTGAAHAQLDVTLSALDPTAPNDKDAAKQPGDKQGPPTPIKKLGAPAFRAVIIGALPGLAADQFTLRQEDSPVPITVKADKVTNYTESDDKMAMVVLIQGDERWMGNETYRDESDPDRQEGAFMGLGPALDSLSKAGPPGSLAAVLIYTSGKAEAKQAMGDASQLGAPSVGSQKDYEGNINIPLLVGLDESIALFDQYPGYRRILVVIGDGTGQEEDIGAGLKERIEKLKQRKAEVFTIHYESVLSNAPDGLNNMKKLGYTHSEHATGRDNFKAFAETFVKMIGARYYATFPGCGGGSPPVCFTHDGQPHEFVVKAGDVESEPIELTTKQWLAPKPKEESSLWWLWVLLAVLVIGIVIAILVLRNREEPAPMPMPVMMAPPPPPTSSKTVMINTGDSSGGLPIVGWIVPVMGANQFQTFKLLQGVTKIGTGSDCNIVIQDSFMSTRHAEIVCSPSGFVLRDGGSTNGTYVNDRRVTSHDLVDNDMVMMGKTSFKFKSIN